MKFNQFLIAGAAVAVLSLSSNANAQSQDNQNNNASGNSSQEINPTAAKTLNSIGGFFGSLAHGAKGVLDTTTNGLKTIANSEGAQNIKAGVVKGGHFVASTASDVSNSEVGQAVKDTAVKGGHFVASTASDVAHSEVGQSVKDTAVKGGHFVASTASDISNSEVGQSVKDTAVKGGHFVASTASTGVKAVSKGYKDSNTTATPVEPTVETASITPVSQAASTPSVSEGISSAKNKLSSMIGFLRAKATTSENTNSADTPKP